MAEPSLLPWFVSGFLDELQEQHEAGFPFALLQAFELCGKARIPAPQWAVESLAKKLQALYDDKAFSWDEVFGAVGPKPGKHRKRITLKAENTPRVYHRVVELQSQGRGVTNLLFQEVADQYGIPEKMCKEIFYEMKARMAEPDPDSPSV